MSWKPKALSSTVLAVVNLPLIELEEGTFKYFFPEGCSILTSFDFNDLYEKIKYYIENPNKLKNMRDKSIAYLDTLSWEKTANEFESILNKIIKEEA